MLEQVPGMVSKNSRFDKLADKKYAQCKKRGLGLAIFELMFVRRDLSHMKEKDAERVLALVETNFSKSKSDPENTAVYSLLKGVLLKQMHQVPNAKECFQKVISLEPEIKVDLWVLPNALQEFGEILYFEGNLDESEKMFKQASKYNNYDWQEVVANRVKFSLQTIKKDKEKKGETVVEEQLAPTTSEDIEIEQQLNSMNLKEDEGLD